MANPIVKAFNLALAGDTAGLTAIIKSGDAPAAHREDGMYKGWSLLHAAASKGHAAACDALLAAGADASVKNPQGRTPAEQAAAKGHDALAAKLSSSSGGGGAAPSTTATLPEALNALQLEPAAADAALEEAFDALIDRLPESEADRLTDAVAAIGDAAKRNERMRQLLEEHKPKPPPPKPPAPAPAPAPAFVFKPTPAPAPAPAPTSSAPAFAFKPLDTPAATPAPAPSPAPAFAFKPASEPSPAPAPAPAFAFKPAPSPAPAPSAPPPPPKPRPTGPGAALAANAIRSAVLPTTQTRKPRVSDASKAAAAEPSPAVIGTLEAMCSESEAYEREMCLELSLLEQLPAQAAPAPAAAAPPPAVEKPRWGDDNGNGGGKHDRLAAKANHDRPKVDLKRAVKRYQRPAAGAPPPSPSELRPLPTLEQTVDYLLNLWCERTDVPQLVRYVFLSDRLRAVQQDLTVQRIHQPTLLARIVRFHALIELELLTLPNALQTGFSSVQNRSLLCNALISALEELHDLQQKPIPVDVSDCAATAAEDNTPLHAELLSYFILLHADEPQTMLTELARAPQAVQSHSATTRALHVCAAYGREDIAGFQRAASCCTILEVSCLLRLLPSVRAAALQQANSAYNAREAVPTAGLCPRLLLSDPADATRCAASHGLTHDPADTDGPPTVRFHASSFTPQVPAKPPEPPLGPPSSLPAVKQWLDRQQREEKQPVAEKAIVTPLSEEAIQKRKAKRRPPPKGFMADDESRQRRKRRLLWSRPQLRSRLLLRRGRIAATRLSDEAAA